MAQSGALVSAGLTVLGADLKAKLLIPVDHSEKSDGSQVSRFALLAGAGVGTAATGPFSKWHATGTLWGGVNSAIVQTAPELFHEANNHSNPTLAAAVREWIKVDDGEPLPQEQQYNAIQRSADRLLRVLYQDFLQHGYARNLGDPVAAQLLDAMKLAEVSFEKVCHRILI